MSSHRENELIRELDTREPSELRVGTERRGDVLSVPEVRTVRTGTERTGTAGTGTPWSYSPPLNPARLYHQREIHDVEGYLVCTVYGVSEAEAEATARVICTAVNRGEG